MWFPLGFLKELSDSRTGKNKAKPDERDGVKYFRHEPVTCNPYHLGNTPFARAEPGAPNKPDHYAMERNIRPFFLRRAYLRQQLVPSFRLRVVAVF
jgi:hypothetical protein